MDNGMHQVNNMGAYGWLSPRKTIFIKTQVGKHVYQTQDFVVLHQLGVGPKSNIVWHTVHTSQIAMVGQANTQVVKVSSVAIKGHSFFTSKSKGT
jgi:hypothetical protein